MKIIGSTVGTPISPNKVVEKADNVQIIVDDVMNDESTNPVQNKVVKDYIDKKTIQMVNVDDFDSFGNPIWTWDSGIYQLYSGGCWLDLDISGKYIVSDGMIIIADVPSLEFKAIYSFCFDTANFEQNLIAILVDSEGNIESDMSAGLFINERIMALESAICELALMGE